MAEEVLVKESITNEMITAGERLARRLNNGPLRIDAMLWFYSAESNSWRFLVATPEVKEYGPRSVYQKIRRIISEMPKEDRAVVFNDIVVIDSQDPLIRLLRTAIRTGKELSNIRFSRNVINGVLIDDAFIYKMG